MADGDKRVFLNLPRDFVQESASAKTGKTFFTVSIPAGVALAGRDLGGYRFHPLFVADSAMNEGWRGVPLLADREIVLRKDLLDDARNPVVDIEGNKVADVLSVMPADLVAAVEAARSAHRVQETMGKKAGEPVWVNVHKSFVYERRGPRGNVFYSVRLAPNTVIAGRDVGGFQFTCSRVNPSKMFNETVGVPLPAGKLVKLSCLLRDEEGRPIVGANGKKAVEEVRVDPGELMLAVDAAREAYRAQQPARRSLAADLAEAKAAARDENASRKQEQSARIRML